MTPRALCLVLVTLIACTAETTDKKANEKKPDEQVTSKTTDHADVGTACVSGSADQPHEVTVDFGLCMSSSCDELVSASCTVERSETELKVSGKASVRRTAGPDTICTTDCRSVATKCSAPALAAGNYKLSYAGKQSEFVVPLGDKACAGG
jgi:hypothetical protein